MSSGSGNSSRIAKNTTMLYFRMILLLLVSLYTSRVNLEALGINDFGIYGVIGGLVGMFWIISTSMVGSINRFLTFELGRENQERLLKIFGSALAFQYIIAAIILIAGETVGLWFLNNKMVIPPDRLIAANWVYQFSLLSFCLDLLIIPYTAAIVAHEKMSAFAYISILTAVGKLVVAWTTMIAPIDHLIWFGGLILVNSTIIRLVYIVYCRRHFEECSGKIIFDRSVWKEMFDFAGWTFIGTTAAVLRDYGGNIVINLFYGPAVNAARVIATQVNGAVGGFADNFMMAVKPQITKNYASGNIDYMMLLVRQGARLSYYILFIVMLPLMCRTDYILKLWLTDVPQGTVLFVQMVLVLTLSECLGGTLITAMLATGHIKKFQIIIGCINLLNLPVSYVVLRLGAIPQSVIIVAIAISVCCNVARILLLREFIVFSVRKFIVKVYFNVLIVSAVSAVAPVLISSYMSDTFGAFVIVSVVALVSSVLAILYIGCDKDERKIVYEKVNVFFTSHCRKGSAPVES